MPALPAFELQRRAANSFQRTQPRGVVYRNQLVPSMQFSEIKNTKIVTDYFGKWPSFHDFEIQRLILDREEVIAGDDPSLCVELIGCRGTAAPAYPNRGDCIIKIRFESIDKIHLAGFNHQNVINDIDIQSIWSEQINDQVLTVKILGAYGIEGEFECRSIRVVSLNPLNRK